MYNKTSIYYSRPKICTIKHQFIIQVIQYNIKLLVTYKRRLMENISNFEHSRMNIYDIKE